MNYVSEHEGRVDNGEGAITGRPCLCSRTTSIRSDQGLVAAGDTKARMFPSHVSSSQDPALSQASASSVAQQLGCWAAPTAGACRSRPEAPRAHLCHHRKGSKSQSSINMSIAQRKVHHKKRHI